MRSFEYGDQEVGHKVLAYAVLSIILGIGILTLPRMIAGVTKGSDGWIGILLGGLISLAFLLASMRLASRFPRKSYYDMASSIIGKPAAAIIIFFLALYNLSFCAYETRAVSVIARTYLFEKTPLEMIVLVFLLVLVYGVSGPSTDLLRLNMMFTPIVFTIAVLVILMNYRFFELNNLKPLFTSSVRGYVTATKFTIFSYLGYSLVILFYNPLVRQHQPKQALKMYAWSIILIMILYQAFFLASLAVFTHDGTAQIIHPAIELAKQIEVPGQFFERLESVFFTIWVMTVFNTAAMAFDMGILALRSLFKKAKRMRLVLILSPIIYIASMAPPNQISYFKAEEIIAYAGMVLCMGTPLALLMIARVRGIKEDA